MDAAGGKINVDVLTSKIEGKLSGEKSLSPQCSIFKIPAIILRHNKNAYEPNAFSFGPFHHGKENLKATETIKTKYLHDLISRLSSPNNDPNPVQTRTLWIKRFTEEARQYYGGPIGMKEDQFVEVLVLDGCFIVELFRKEAYESLKEENDPVFFVSYLHQFLLHDLILLENQIPWMVLATLFNLTLTSIDRKHLVQLAIDFFGNIFSTEPPPIIDPLLSHPSKHILDLLRNSLVLTSRILDKGRITIPEMMSNELEPMPSAKRLEDSGIEIKTSTSNSILDIKFNRKKGVLEMSTLLIQEITETVFQNLIILERCCPNYEPRMTSYAMLLDNLINSKKDMEVLCRSKVIYNWLSDDATRPFNKLCNIYTFTKKKFYLDLKHEVNKYCGQRRHRYRVLVRDYFKHPWAFIAVNAATIVLILTFLQTLFTMMGSF